MRLFRPYYKSRGMKKAKQVRKFYVELSDHTGKARAFPADADKDRAQTIGSQIQRLINFKAGGNPLDVQSLNWVSNLGGKYRSLKNALVRVGLVDSHAVAGGKPLREHLAEFKEFLLAKGDTAKQAKLVSSRAQKVINGCGFVLWVDVSASKVMQYLAQLRQDTAKKRGISAQTFNFYLQGIKQFCRWMMEDRRVTENPLQFLKGLNVRTDRRHDRRALSIDEVRRLLETAASSEERFGMTGIQRAMLYQIAIETGLRAGEMRSLTVASFDFKGGKVIVEAAYSKHRREDILPIRPDTAARLQGFFAGKMPSVKAFTMPPANSVAKMLKADLAQAKIDYRDEAGRVVDFHGLRHTTGSMLAASGAHPKIAQTIMRHSKIDLTMSVYSHVFRGQESQAVEALPDFMLPSIQRQHAIKTGTDNLELTNPQSKLTAKLTGQGGTNPYIDGQTKGGSAGTQVNITTCPDNSYVKNPKSNTNSEIRFSKPLPSATRSPLQLQPFSHHYNRIFYFSKAKICRNQHKYLGVKPKVTVWLNFQHITVEGA